MSQDNIEGHQNREIILTKIKTEVKKHWLSTEISKQHSN